MHSHALSPAPANKTGTESVYTTHDGFEMMFHVSTLLPFSSSDSSQVRRHGREPAGAFATFY